MSIEQPLHPLLVHLPLGLIAVLPGLTTWGLIARRRSSTPGTIWAVVVVLHAVLAVSAWFAAEIGERQVHVVRQVIEEHILEAHAAAGQRLKIVTGLAFLICLVGIARDRVGRIGRATSTALACVLLFLG